MGLRVTALEFQTEVKQAKLVSEQNSEPISLQFPLIPISEIDALQR